MSCLQPRLKLQLSQSHPKPGSASAREKTVKQVSMLLSQEWMVIMCNLDIQREFEKQVIQIDGDVIVLSGFTPLTSKLSQKWEMQVGRVQLHVASADVPRSGKGWTFYKLADSGLQRDTANKLMRNAVFSKKRAYGNDGPFVFLGYYHKAALMGWLSSKGLPDSFKINVYSGVDAIPSGMVHVPTCESPLCDSFLPYDTINPRPQP